MSPGRLLDTSIVVPMLRGEQGLRERLSPGDNYLSIVILGELYLGALLSNRAQENLEKVRRLATSLTTLPCTEETSRNYAEIGQRLEALGRRIPQNDQWIAATARQHGLTLVHRDEHFDRIDLNDLEKEVWAHDAIGRR